MQIGSLPEVAVLSQELEEKIPLIEEQRRSYEDAVESVTSICKQNDELVEESRQLRTELCELRKSAGDHERERERLRQEVKDLPRQVSSSRLRRRRLSPLDQRLTRCGLQVCYLLKEVEEARGGVVSMEDDVSLNNSFGANDVSEQN